MPLTGISIKQTQKMKVDFANPHSPWERGTNENTNGLLRAPFLQGSDMRSVTASRLARVERMLSNRPRKCLNYRTPARSSAPCPVLRFGIESARHTSGRRSERSRRGRFASKPNLQVSHTNQTQPGSCDALHPVFNPSQSQVSPYEARSVPRSA